MSDLHGEAGIWHSRERYGEEKQGEKVLKGQRGHKDAGKTKAEEARRGGRRVKVVYVDA